MPLLLLDLDNTLIDRDAAWRAGLTAFLRRHRLPLDHIEWMMAIDRSGHAPRSEVAAQARERFGDALPRRAFREFLRWGAADNVSLDQAVLTTLRQAAEAGWRPVIVTNGAITQQAAKVRNAGLDTAVAGCVISGSLGARKPAPEIFHAAADVVGGSLDGAWMIGDTAEADIAGAVRLGLPNVWLHRDRRWPTDLGYRPTLPAGSLIEAIRYVMGNSRETDPRGQHQADRA